MTKKKGEITGVRQAYEMPRVFNYGSVATITKDEVCIIDGQEVDPIFCLS